MCGLLITSRAHVSEAKHNRAGCSMLHRGLKHHTMQGPVWNVSHIRLPINGLDDEFQQPFVLGKRLAAMVGEYYDFDLEVSPCDAIHLIARWIEDPMRYNPGMYHGVIIEGIGVTVFQDLLGKKPFYYREDIPAFASEVKALTMLGPCTWNEEYENHVTNGLLPSIGHTPYKEIKRIVPGELKQFFLLDKTLISSTLQFNDFDIAYRNLDDLDLALNRAVCKRFKADIPVGMLISGGIDSSLLYKIATFQGYNPYVFHIENREENYLKMLDIPPDRLVPLKIPPRFNLKEVLYHNETYMDYGSMVPQFYLGQAFKHNEEFRVVITGDGADELFAGYKRAQRSDTSAYDMDELKIWHLPRIDKMMMSGTVEARCPYLDEEVVNCVGLMSWEEKKGKQPIKQLAERYNVPEEIIKREKKPLRYKAYENDKASWRRTLHLTFKRAFNRRLKWSM